MLRSFFPGSGAFAIPPVLALDEDEKHTAVIREAVGPLTLHDGPAQARPGVSSLLTALAHHLSWFGARDAPPGGRAEGPLVDVEPPRSADAPPLSALQTAR